MKSNELTPSPWSVPRVPTCPRYVCERTPTLEKSTKHHFPTQISPGHPRHTRHAPKP